MKNQKFKKDIYSKNRRNYSEFLNLYCRKCGKFISKYQKDGPGKLLRIYIDRTMDNKNICDFKVDRKLYCPNCKSLLGLGYIYKKENRPAYKLFQESLIKKTC